MRLRHEFQSGGALRAAELDAASGVLTLTYSSGESRHYANFNAADFEGLKSAKKPGQWVAEMTRKRAADHPEVQADGSPLAPAAPADAAPSEQPDSPAPVARLGGELVEQPPPREESWPEKLARGLREFHESSRVAPLEGQEPLADTVTFKAAPGERVVFAKPAAKIGE